MRTNILLFFILVVLSGIFFLLWKDSEEKKEEDKLPTVEDTRREYEKEMQHVLNALEIGSEIAKDVLGEQSLQFKTASVDKSSQKIINDTNKQLDTSSVPSEPTANKNTIPTAIGQFAECLAMKNLKMYGTAWCGHCKNQKSLFGEASDKLRYIDCDAERQVCLDAGIRGFPTWVDSKGRQYPGTQTLEKLAEVAGCKLP